MGEERNNVVAASSVLSGQALFTSRSWRPALAVWLAIAISACSGGAPGSKESVSTKENAPPVFKGAVLSYSGGKGSLSLHWPAAADTVTPADKMVYKIYIGGSPDAEAIAQLKNLKLSVTNKTTAAVYGLTPGGTYYCLVKAVDEAGNQSLNTDVTAVTVLSTDLIAVPTPKVLEKMNVSVTQSDASHAVISGPDAASVLANDILVMDNPYGQSLKKVVTAINTGETVAVTLKDAGLGEVVQSGSIGSATLMASVSTLPAQKTGGEIPGTANVQYKDPAGFFEITEYGVSDDPGAKAAKDMAKYGEMISFAPGITLGYSILFEPELVTSSQFDPSQSPNTLTSIMVSAKGTLNFDAKALYELKDAASVDVTKRVLNRVIAQKYAVGAVPVVQDTYLEVMAHLQLNAGAPLNMYAELFTSKTVEIAFEWTRETGWRQVNSDTLDQRITLNILSEGQIVGTLELFPIISTRFHKAVKTGSYKIPELGVNADVRIIPPPLEVSVFDTSVHVDSYMAASTKVFGFTIAEWEKERKEIQNQKLSATPTVELADAGKKGTDVPLDLKIADAGVEKAEEAGTSGSAPIRLDDLVPAVVSTSETPYIATLTASGGNLKNVEKVTFNVVRIKSGAKEGTYIWIKNGKYRGRPWDSRVIINPDGTLTLKPIITTPGDSSRQTSWTVTLSDKHGTTASKSFLVDYSSASATSTVSAIKEPKQSAPVETVHAAVTPAPVKVAPPVEKAQAPVTPPPAPKPEPVKVIPPVEKAQAPVTPPPAPKSVPAPVPAPPPVPVKVIPPVEKAQTPVTSPDTSIASAIGAAVSDLMGGAIQRTLSVAGTVSTFAGAANTAGSTDGPTATARFNYLHGITADGKNLYITDQSGGTIRKVVIATGAVSTLAGSAGSPGSADGAGTAAKFYLPEGITTDGVNLYVADRNNQTIRKIVIATGAVTTLAGRPGTPGSADGLEGAARFAEPNGITTDGKNLYVTDKKNHAIRQIVIATGAVTTLAGKAGVSGSADGMGAAAQFASPAGITTDGKNIFVADQYNYAIRKIVIATGAVTTLAGKAGVSGSADGTGAAAQFSGPAGITTDGQNLYVTEPLKNTVRKVVIATGVVTTLSSGEGAAAQFKSPKGITSDGTYLYVADYGNQTVKKIK